MLLLKKKHKKTKKKHRMELNSNKCHSIKRTNEADEGDEKVQGNSDLV